MICAEPETIIPRRSYARTNIVHDINMSATERMPDGMKNSGAVEFGANLYCFEMRNSPDKNKIVASVTEIAEIAKVTLLSKCIVLSLKDVNNATDLKAEDVQSVTSIAIM